MLQNRESLTPLNQLLMGLESCFLVLKQYGLRLDVFDIYQQVVPSMVNLSLAGAFKQEFRTMLCSNEVRYQIMRVVLCRLIAKKLNLKSDFYLKKIYMACFLCDIGEYHENTKNEYHGLIGANLALSQKMPEDIAQAILHHHEYEDGSGPMQSTRHNIHPIAKIIRVSEEWLSRMSLTNANYPQDFANLAPEKLDAQIAEACLSLFKK